MRILDLFCGAGGAAMGYHRAGFEVVGVDINPQPNYPFEFHQVDALKVLEHMNYLDQYEGTGYRVVCFGMEYEGAFHAIHASPPCQAYSVANNIHGRTDHPDLIGPVRELLEATRLPWVIENVPRAPLVGAVTVCGRSFDPPLGVKRHRLFEANFPLVGTTCPKGHPGRDWVTIFGHTVLERSPQIGRTAKDGPIFRRKHLGTDVGRRAMDCEWMNRDELSEAIPPAYTEFIGRQLAAHLSATKPKGVPCPS